MSNRPIFVAIYEKIDLIRLIANLIFVLAIFFVALPEGLRSDIGTVGIPIKADTEMLRNSWGLSDAGSFLEIAKTWANLESITPEQLWILRLWAPGMSLVEVPLIWLSSIGVPIFISLLILTSIIWLGILNLVIDLVKDFRIEFQVALVLLFEITVISSWDFQYIFRESLFHSEGIGYGLLFLGLLGLSKTLLSKESARITTPLIFYGFIVGCSVWVRHVLDSGLLLTLLASFLTWALIQLRHQKIKQRQPKGKKRKFQTTHFSKEIKNFGGTVKMITLAFIVAFLVTLPWRIINPVVFENRPLVMSASGDQIFKAIWYPDNSPHQKIYGYFGGNWACKIDQSKCEAFNLAGLDTYAAKDLGLEAIDSVVRNPIKFMQVRLIFLAQNWIPNMRSGANPLEVNSSLLPLGILLTLLIGFFNLWKNTRIQIILLIWLPMLLSQALQLSLIHYESRYFIPIRILILGLSFSLIKAISDIHKLNKTENKNSP